MKRLLLLAAALTLLLAGCAREDCPGPLSYGFDLSKCPEWAVCQMGDCRSMNTTAMVAFCQDFDPLFRTCDHEGYTYSLDCAEAEKGFVICNGKVIA